jgi:hypothetical protein
VQRTPITWNTWSFLAGAHMEAVAGGEFLDARIGPLNVPLLRAP